jgi:ferredoxin
MPTVTEQIRAVAKQLLAEQKVDLVIGFRQASQPLRATPHFARTPAEADRLVWSLGCTCNLVKYLLGRKDRVAIVAKGCDARAVLAYAKEKQIDRSRVTVIGVPCLGVASQQKLDQVLRGRGLREAFEDGEAVVLRGNGFEERVPAAELLQDSCKACAARDAVECDVRVGPSQAAAAPADPYADVRELEAMSPDRRWQWFCRETSRCIRCYACRNACPACYCEQCFVDRTSPEWIGKGNDLTDTQVFHIVRALHSAGRCVDCGACERACPMGIALRKLTRKVQKDVHEMFGTGANADASSPPELSTFGPDDPQEFIR